MNVADTSAWLEYFLDGPNAEVFEPMLWALGDLIVPTITLYEVQKKFMSQWSKEAAARALGMMSEGNVVDLSASIAVMAAHLSFEFRLPMADSIILATARAYDATLWTQDAHFEGIPGVEYRKAQA